MSLSLATKGRLHGGESYATNGVIYVFGALAELVVSVLPQVIARRIGVEKIARRLAVSKIVRREDA